MLRSLTTSIVALSFLCGYSQDRPLSLPPDVKAELVKAGHLEQDLADLVVKDDYQTKLNECHMKIKLHSAKTREYDGWVQFLSVRTDAIELDWDDYLFFYGD